MTNMGYSLLNDKYQRVYYVYTVYVDGVLKYIGRGKGNRIDHCKSGKSSCKELNNDFFQNKNIEVIKVEENLTLEEADQIELDWILSNIDNGIYNKKTTSDYFSKPNLSSNKNVNIIAEDMDNKVIKQFCKLNPNIEKEEFMRARDYLGTLGLSFYLVKFGKSSQAIVIDKSNVSAKQLNELSDMAEEIELDPGDIVGHRG